jgi:hypothetical protein
MRCGGRTLLLTLALFLAGSLSAQIVGAENVRLTNPSAQGPDVHKAVTLNDILSGCNAINTQAPELVPLMNSEDRKTFESAMRDVTNGLMALSGVGATGMNPDAGVVRPEANPDLVPQLSPNLRSVQALFDRLYSANTGKAERKMLDTARKNVRKMIVLLPDVLPRKSKR